MTRRSEHDHRLREFKNALLTRLAGRAMSTKQTGVDGLAKTLLARGGKNAIMDDPELEHPEAWDRPVD